MPSTLFASNYDIYDFVTLNVKRLVKFFAKTKEHINLLYFILISWYEKCAIAHCKLLA